MKAQIWSIDFAISVVIFITTVIIFFFAFNTLSADSARQQELLRMQDLSLEATESLVRAAGIPDDWTPQTVQVIGLAEKNTRPNETQSPQENFLNSTLVLRFLDIDYNTSKRLMGLGPYEYYLEIRKLDGSPLQLNSTLAKKGPSYAPARDIISVQRYAIVNHTFTKLQFLLWR